MPETELRDEVAQIIHTHHGAAMARDRDAYCPWWARDARSAADALLPIVERRIAAETQELADALRQRITQLDRVRADLPMSALEDPAATPAVFHYWSLTKHHYPQAGYAVVCLTDKRPDCIEFETLLWDTPEHGFEKGDQHAVEVHGGKGMRYAKPPSPEERMERRFPQ